MAQTTTQRVAGKIRALLGEQRRSGRWLARAVGMPPTTFNRRLIGAHAFDVNELDAVARALGVSPKDLLDEEENPEAGAA